MKLRTYLKIGRLYALFSLAAAVSLFALSLLSAPGLYQFYRERCTGLTLLCAVRFIAQSIQTLRYFTGIFLWSLVLFFIFKHFKMLYGKIANSLQEGDDKENL
ncbi:MAG: hypothetical protein ACTTKL_06370 [Treponema sp.]